MKRLIIGDLHLNKSNLDDLEDFFKFLYHIRNLHGRYELCYQPMEAVFLGDIYCTKAIIRSEAQNYLLTKIRECLSKWFSKTYFLVGNHDFESLECNRHALFALKNVVENVIVVDDVLEVEDSLFLPYQKNKDEFLSKIRACKQYPKYIYGHQGFAGFDLGNGILDKDGVNKYDIEKNTRVFLGHYHKPQVLENIIYVGSPISHSFGETNQLKYIIEQDQDNLISHSVVGVSRHLDYEFAAKDFNNTSFELPNEKDNVRVIIRGSKEDCNKIDYEKVKDLIKSFRTLRVKYEFTDIVKQASVSDNLSIESMLQSYLKQNKLDHVLDKSLDYLKDAYL